MSRTFKTLDQIPLEDEATKLQRIQAMIQACLCEVTDHGKVQLGSPHFRLLIKAEELANDLVVEEAARTIGAHILG